MRITLIVIIYLMATKCFGQDSSLHRYDPDENAEEVINRAIGEGKLQQKNVLVFVGGNWCFWCGKLEKFMKGNREIDSIIKSNYVLCFLNYSKENYNSKVMIKFGFSPRFGFPVIFVLDSSGKLIHSQDTGLLEEGNSYSEKRVRMFLEAWSIKAMDLRKYIEFWNTKDGLENK